MLVYVYVCVCFCKLMRCCTDSYVNQQENMLLRGIAVYIKIMFVYVNIYLYSSEEITAIFVDLL